MEWWEPFIYIFGGMALLMLAGMPLVFAFLIVNMLGIWFLQGGGRAFDQLAMSMYASVSSFSLAPVPLFILMGEMLWRSGIASRTLETLDLILGRVVGRQSILAVLTGTVFATVSGSTMANTAMLGSALYPDMARRGYKVQMSVGPILASGGLAMMIPPSTLAVIFASLAQLSVSAILLGGLIPGLLLASCYVGYILLRCWINPSLAPPVELGNREELGTVLRKIVVNLLPLAGIVFLVTGLIVFGVATPTEAAALGCAGSFMVVATYRALTWEIFRESMLSMIRVTGMIFALLIGATGFSQILAYSGATIGLLGWIMGQGFEPLIIIIAFLAAAIFLGTFMEQVSIMLITLPIVIPTVTGLGYDPIWFGIMMLIALQMGLTTPPFGLLLFVIKGVLPQTVRMRDIYKSCIPFLLCDGLVLALVVTFPFLTHVFR